MKVWVHLLLCRKGKQGTRLGGNCRRGEADNELQTINPIKKTAPTATARAHMVCNRIVIPS